jgi:type I restriction enzyme R subunit
MSSNEAKARIKINHLLEEAGWRFFDDDNGSANIQLELNTKITQTDIDAFGEDFETTRKGFLDFLLLDDKGFPLIVLEAKSEEKDPLSAKEQARSYAQSVKCRFIILSNGNIHYFWDTEKGNSEVITRFPEAGSMKGYKDYKPDPEQLIREKIDKDYIALTQKPDYASDAGWLKESERDEFIKKNRLRFLREYQIQAF